VERVLVVFPTLWDERALRGPGRAGAGRVEAVFAEPSDADCPARLDPEEFIARWAAEGRGRLRGVFSSSDYPGAPVAAAIAERLGLAGPPPAAVLRSAHKYLSRAVQREVAPEAAPDFALVAPGRAPGEAPPLPYPFFVKPVKGSFSVLARRVADEGQLAALLAAPAAREYMGTTMLIFNQLARRYGLELDGSWFLAEGLLRGRLVTVEGCAGGAGVRFLGVTDSSVQPRTGSFTRFDYPSALPASLQARMEALARAVVERLGLRHTMFNVEMMVDEESGRLSIVEVNPRMCGQFADLYEKVNGRSGYEVALDLALGQEPAFERGAGRFAAAASVPLRVFEPVRVTRAPGPAEIAALEAEMPGLRVWSEVKAGDVLADFASSEDGHSARYAIVNLGAADRGELEGRIEAVRARLGFGFEPVAAR
jgi:biotin carboxylase